MKSRKLIGVYTGLLIIAVATMIMLWRLKTMPKGYPREHPYGEYIKMKEYLLEHKCPDSYFTEGDWVEKAARDFRIMKPFHDFMNFAIEDMGLV